MILRRAGAVVDFDRRGDSMLLQLTKFVPDLIILDLNLGRYTSGFEIFEETRKLPEYAHVPIVAVSASEPAVVVPKCRTMGFNGFIAKPIAEALFEDQLVRLLQGESVWYLGERYGGEESKGKESNHV
ncbi:MAG: response regulator [Chloroflexi bacterium]|nr:response regulator [Chloroflexota bacterium]